MNLYRLDISQDLKTARRFTGNDRYKELMPLEQVVSGVDAQKQAGTAPRRARLTCGQHRHRRMKT
jgi:hypothetical protein